MNLQNLCRVCIREDVEMISIFQFYNFYENCLAICEVITNCASVQIHKLDGFSAQICKNCLDDLCRAFRFKLTCEASDYKFRNNLIPSDKITISSTLPIVQDEYNDNAINKEVPSSSDNGLSAIKGGFYEGDGVLKNQLYDSTNITTFLILNAVPSLETTSAVISDRFTEEDINCSEGKSKEAAHTSSQEHGLTEIKRESHHGSTQIEYGENLIEEESITKSSTEITALQNLTSSQKTDSNGKSFKCEFCNRSYNRKSNLNVHMRIHTGEKPYKCETCGKCFYKKSILDAHKMNHTGQKPYKCDACGKCFQQMGTLNIHKRTHTGDKPFKCETCGKCFNQKGLLNVHIRIHTGEIRHECDTCGRCFQHKGTLNVHKRAHTGHKPFKCETCGRCFSRNGSLNTHKKIHTSEEKRYKCGICGKSFNSMRDISRHHNSHLRKNSKPTSITPSENESLEIKTEFYEEETQIRYGTLENNLHEDNYKNKSPSTNITTTQILNDGAPGSLESTASASDVFPQEDIKIDCSEVNSKIIEKNEEVSTSLDYELIEIKSESYKECGVLENTLQEEDVTKPSTELDSPVIQNLDNSGSLQKPGKSYKCEFCNKVYNKKTRLNVHMRIHTGEKLYKCETCGKCFTLHGHFKTHIMGHTGLKPYKCDTCGKCFNQSAYLKLHIRTHTGEMPYSCETCGRGFKQKSSLNVHKRSHTGEKPYKCETCGKGFRHTGDLKRHSKIHTCEKPYQCETCDKSFRLKENLRTHMRIHTGDKPYKCETCGKCFNQTGLLTMHMRLHTGEQRHKCGTCGKCFQQKGSLINHQRIHTGDKPYKCETCGKCFNQKGRLNIHLRIHTGEIRHKCDICGKCFQQKGSLNIHMRAHTGHKPYKCEDCDRCFNQKSSLNVHRRIHTGDMPYKCETCGKSFNQRGDINRHIKIHLRENLKYNFNTPFDNGLSEVKTEFYEEEQIQFGVLENHLNEGSSKNSPTDITSILNSEITEILVKTEPEIIDTISEEQ